MTSVQIQALNEWARTAPALRGAFKYLPSQDSEPSGGGLGTSIGDIEDTAEAASVTAEAASNAVGDVYVRVTFELGIGSSSIEDIVTIPATKGIASICVLVDDTAFNATAQLSIGSAEEPELLMAEKEIDLSIGGTYVSAPPIVFSSDTLIKAFFTSGGSTAGSATIRITYG